MTVLVLAVAVKAEVKVFAQGACDELGLLFDANAAVARTAWLQGIAETRLEVFGKGAWHLSNILRLGSGGKACLWLWCEALSGAADDFAVLDESLHQPVIFTRT